MLSKADDYPFHQTAEPMAFAGTDRNFYDRFFFNGYAPDGGTMFALAFGLYPQLDIMDASLSVAIGGAQHSLRASKHMGGERVDLRVGPVTVEIVEPLQQHRITVDAPEMRAELTATARHFPVEEPRFTRRIGTRSLMDVTRMTQNMRWSGWIEVGGERWEVSDWMGTRDRSWGVRPVGASDPQPPTEGALSQFFWLWTPANFEDVAVFCHTNDDEYGRPWNRRAVIVPTDGREAREFEQVALHYDWVPGTRRLQGMRAVFGEDEAELRLTCHGTPFYMTGLGYGHPEWGHGHDKGPQAVQFDTTAPTRDRYTDMMRLHIQSPARAELVMDGRTRVGRGVVEQLFIGPNSAAGLSGLLDPHA
jgi:hypothetical protein